MNPILINCLGKGSAGIVYLCKLPNSEENYAVKILDRKEADRPQVKKYFKTEIDIMNELKDNNNIIHFIGLQKTSSQYKIIMEYCNGGSLLSCLKNYLEKYKKPFPEEYVQHLMRQIVNGLIYIHDHDIIHRDIKLDNILVKFASEKDKNKLNMINSQIKICDFGMSARGSLAYTVTGTQENMDPFILKKLNERNDLKNSEGYNKNADIWSLGTVCYEMLIGQKPFNGRNQKDLYHNVESGNYSIPINLSKEVVSFINGMLQYDPDKRLTAKELSRHYFLTRNINEFHEIDSHLLKSRIGKSGLRINTIKNKRIWDIFNEDEEVFNSITSTNFLELTPSDEYKNKNVVPQFLERSRANNMQKLNNLNNAKNNNLEKRRPGLKPNEVMKNYQRQKTHNIINNNINSNKNNNNYNKNYLSKSQVCSQKDDYLFQKMNLQKSNHIYQNEYAQTNNTSEKVIHQNNNNNYPNFYNQNDNSIFPNINNQNNNNIYKNIIDKINNQSIQVSCNPNINKTYQNINNQNNSIYNSVNSQNINYTYQNVNNQNKNNIFNYGYYSNHSSINNAYIFPK